MRTKEHHEAWADAMMLWLAGLRTDAELIYHSGGGSVQFEADENGKYVSATVRRPADASAMEIGALHYEVESRFADAAIEEASGYDARSDQFIICYAIK